MLAESSQRPLRPLPVPLLLRVLHEFLRTLVHAEVCQVDETLAHVL